MDVNGRRGSSYDQSEAEEEAAMELRRGPWTVEEDLTLINYIANHGEGRWNSLARCAGLKRTGKSCRLRWLNYLRPDVRRGNITLEEQLLILDLHSRWGNRWSKIAQYLPGRTDNEIKNYWRTRVQKHAKQLKCDVNSKQFKDTMKYLWMPRLVERIQAASTNPATVPAAASMAVASPEGSTITTNTTTTGGGNHHSFDNNMDSIGTGYGGTMEINSGTTASSSDSFDAQVSNLSDYYAIPAIDNSNIGYFPTTQGGGYQDHEPITGYYSNTDYGALDYQAMDQNQNYQWMDNGDTSGNLWNVEDINWYLNHNI